MNITVAPVDQNGKKKILVGFDDGNSFSQAVYFDYVDAESYEAFCEELIRQLGEAGRYFTNAVQNPEAG